MHFGAGRVADALGVSRQSLGHLASDLLSDRPPRKHHNFTPAEVLWLAAYRHARAAGLEAWPCRAFIGGAAMRAMLAELLARAAPDPREAVKRLQKISVLFGARYRFTESGHETELRGEPLLLEAQRLPAKLAEPCAAAGGAGVERLTVFATPLAAPLNALARLIEENRNAT